MFSYSYLNAERQRVLELFELLALVVTVSSVKVTVTFMLKGVKHYHVLNRKMTRRETRYNRSYLGCDFRNDTRCSDKRSGTLVRYIN